MCMFSKQVWESTYREYLEWEEVVKICRIQEDVRYANAPCEADLMAELSYEPRPEPKAHSRSWDIVRGDWADF